MKHSIIRRGIGIFLVLALLFGLLPTVSFAGNADVVIAAWEQNAAIDAQTLFSATTGAGNLTHSDADLISVSQTGEFTHTGWTTDKYWLISGMDAAAYVNLRVAFRAATYEGGPANWVLEYSSDLGDTWTEFGGYTLSNTSTYVCDGIPLPDAAICENLCVRFRPRDNTSLNGRTITNNGISKLRNIKLIGMPHGYQTLAQFDFIAEDKATIALPATATEGYGYLASTVTATPEYITDMLSAKNWQEDDYWLMVFNTSGCTDIRLSASFRSSGTGPRDFAAEFSTDNGATWTAFGGYSMTGTLEKRLYFQLPDEAQSPNLQVRFRVNSSYAVNGGTIGKLGNSKIDDIELTADVGLGRQDDPAMPIYPGGFSSGGQAEQEDVLRSDALAGWLFSEAVSLPAVANVGYGYLVNSVTTNPEYTGSALSVKRWSSGAYWMMLVNTTGYTDMKLKAKLMGTSTAPRDYALEYSLDGTEWTRITAFSVTAALTLYTFNIPDEAQGANCMLRFVVTSSTAVGSTEAAPVSIGISGAGKLNFVELTGTKTGTHEPNPTQPSLPEDYKPSELDPSPGNAEIVGSKLAYWEFAQAAKLPATATEGWGTLSHSSSAYTVFSSKALSQTGWVAGNYWQFVVNTSGCTQMTIDLRTCSSATGPRNISMRYSTDLGQTWVEFAMLSLTTSLKEYAVKIPDSAQSTNLVVRLVAADNESINGNTIKNGGSNKINKIGFYGVTSDAHQGSPLVAAYPVDWTVVSNYDAASVYIPEPDEAAVVAGAFTAGERRTIARWGGNANYEGALNIYGDLVSANDRLDGAAELTTVVKNENVTPGFCTASTNSTNYYMGSKLPCIGSGYLLPAGVEEADYEIDENTVWTDDYIQLKLSTAKYTDLGMSLRLRVSNKGPKELTVRYSADGETWLPFTGGHYDYAYTGYAYGGATYDVSDEGEIQNGVIPVKVQGNYMNVQLDVPQGAENQKVLYIRFYASHESCVESSTGNYVTDDASLRLDTLELTGCPMLSSDICSAVTVNVEGSVPAGQELTFATETPDAVIKYSMDYGETVLTYDAQNKPTLTAFPALFKVWAEKEGMQPSVKTYYYYTQAQVGTVKAKPNGGAVSAGTQLRFTCATEGAQIRYSFDDGASWLTYSDASRPTLTEALLENGCRVMVMGVKEGYLNSPVSLLSFTKRLNAKYNLYFGQLHSHTNYSDGAGTCEEAFRHATQVKNLDFLAVTDHSNAFDNDTNASLADGSMSTKWVSGHELADQFTTDGEFVCLYGYEMTWSNGLGHMNTYNSAGFQSRTQNEFSSYSTALQNYYNALKGDVNTISQFNHPGTTFGDFRGYSYYDEDIDELITLLEVGNGEGDVGSSGYFPSYEEYTRALDLGWHIAPTNNQDNHKGKWGDANTTRSVIMADSLTRNNIYDAMRNRRVYATEDNDLHLYYTLDGYEMGTILTEDDVSDTLELSLELSDATDRGSCRVQVIANGGMVVANSVANAAAETLTFELPASYSYYFIRVTQDDGNIAVTAPVWIGEVESVGVSALTADTELPVQGETLTLTAELYNNEDSDLQVSSIEFFADGEKIHTVDLAKAGLRTLNRNTTKSYSFPYTSSAIGASKIQVRMQGIFENADKQYNGETELSFLPAELVTEVLIDGTHYNDYVTGYSEGNVTKIAELGAEQFARVTVVKTGFTSAMLENCDLLIITAPAKRTLETYQLSTFEPAFCELVSDYMQAGGSVVLCGMSDYQDSTACQTHTQMNNLLAAIGSTMRLRSDELVEQAADGTLNDSLEFTHFNTASMWLKGANGNPLNYTTQGACSVDLSGAQQSGGFVTAAEPLIYGNESTYSVDIKNDAGYSLNNALPHVVEKGNVIAGAVQQTREDGQIFLFGGAFLSDSDLFSDNNEPRVNAVLLENILAANAATLPVTDIAQVRMGEQNDVFCIEGYVTAGTDNENTTFFDTVYVQDATGGITIYPFSETGIALGTKLRIYGYLDDYQDDLELQVLKYEILDGDTQVISPAEMSCQDAMNYAANGGKLLKTSGTITEVQKLGQTVTQLRLSDERGDVATVFIDGYITSAGSGLNELEEFCDVGNTVSAVGLCFMHPEAGSDVSTCCLRVRNCDEIVLLAVPDPTDPTEPTEPITEPTEPVTEPTEPITEPTEPITEPTEPITEPTEPVTEPTEPVTDPTEPVTDPTEPVTDPTDPIDDPQKLSTIAQMRAGAVGERFCIEGYLTAAQSDTKSFFQNTVYLQDATGGVAVCDVDGLPQKVGAKLRVTGRVTVVEGDIELRAERCEVASGDAKLYLPTVVSCQNAMNYAGNGGKLLKTTGMIVGVEKTGDTVTSLRLMDAEGAYAQVLVEGSVHSLSTGKNALASFCKIGTSVRVTGLCYMQGSGCCLRVRDCDEVVKTDCMPNCPSEVFSDLETGDKWYHAGIDYCIARGLMNGVGSGKFEPNGNLTRAMLVTILYRVENEPSVSGLTNPFTDVPQNKWYTDAVIWAAQEGIVNGMSATMFAPNTNITREQIATILYRYSGETAGQGDLTQFPDASSVSPWASEAMQWAIDAGIIRGTDIQGETYLNPLGKATRAEVATMLLRYLTQS